MKNIKKSYKNNKFNIPDATWNDNFQLTDECYSISDIYDYFKYIIKKHKTPANSRLIQININKINNSLNTWNYEITLKH